MFAILNDQGAIAYLSQTEPTQPVPPDPLPENYVPLPPIVFRPVVDASKPAITMPYSTIVEKPLSEWTVTPTQVIREFTEYIPPLADCRAIKRARMALTAHVEHETGIAVTLTLLGGAQPYGTLVFSADHETLCRMLACCTACDLEIRNNAAAADNLTPMILANLSVVPVKCGHGLRICKLYFEEHHRRHVALANKLRAAQQATTLNDLNAIT